MNKHKVSRIVIATLLITAVLSMGAFSLAGAEETPPVHLIPCPHAVVDSSDEIEEALVTAVEDEVIQLEACTYYVSRVIEVRTAFHGTLRGAGKDLTVIEILPGHKLQAIVPYPEYDPNFYASYIFFFYIPSGQVGDISITDLSMVVTDPEPAEGQTDQEWYQGALHSLITVIGDEVNSTFDRLRLTGTDGNFCWSNMGSGITIEYDQALVHGDQTITNVDISDIALGINLFFMGAGKIKVTDNTFTHIGCRAVNAVEFSNNHVEFSDNEIAVHPGSEGMGMLTVFQGIFLQPLGPSSFLITRNHIASDLGEGGLGILFIQGASWDPATPFPDSYLTITKNDIQTTGDGIIVEDDDYWFTGNETVHTVISKNNIFLNNASWGAIQLIGGQGTRITNNRIYGKGRDGIYMGIFPDYGERVEGVSIKNNNLSNLEAEIAQVWLGGGTSNCKVVGGKFRPDVLDQGTDNILIKVNELSGEMSATSLARASRLQGAASKLSALDTLKWMMGLRGMYR